MSSCSFAFTFSDEFSFKQIVQMIVKRISLFSLSRVAALDDEYQFPYIFCPHLLGKVSYYAAV